MTSELTIIEGALVRHPRKPEWGLGKVLTIRGNTAAIHFKDDPADYRTIMLDVVQLIVAEEKFDPMLDNLPPFVDGAFAAKAKKVTFQQGVEAFTKQFPGGFTDPLYLEGKDGATGGERGYKFRAHERYLDTLGEGRGEALLKSGRFDELRDLLQGVVTKGGMNLLSLYEAMALREGLAASDDAAEKYFEALFAFVKSCPDQKSFNALSDAVRNLPAEPGRARVATWPVLTLLPFLADPTRFMFLKPEPTNACADRLRFNLLYDSALRWATYERLLQLSANLLEQLKTLGARDFIDVQSFMWVIQKY